MHDVSFTLRAGEILGLAGLVGAGRSETVETIFGLRRARAGSMTLNGAAFAPHRPSDAIRAAWRWCQRTGGDRRSRPT